MIRSNSNAFLKFIIFYPQEQIILTDVAIIMVWTDREMGRVDGWIDVDYLL